MKAFKATSVDSFGKLHVLCTGAIQNGVTPDEPTWNWDSNHFMRKFFSKERADIRAAIQWAIEQPTSSAIRSVDLTNGVRISFS